MKRIFASTNALIAVVVGVLVLAGYFAPSFFGWLRSLLLQWAVILSGFALLVGIYNLFSVHLKKMRSGKNALYSAALVISLFVTLLVAGISGPTGAWSLWVFNTFQVPVEASLLAVLAVVLLFAAARLLSRRLQWQTLLFTGAVLVTLLGAAPLYLMGEVPALSALHNWVSNVPAVAGVRGLLLGVGLGTLLTGLRLLMGVDRPYGD